MRPALKRLARVKAIQRQLFEQWAVLETLTPIEYAQFRDQLGHSSGFQSVQYRIVEFLLGNKNSVLVDVEESFQLWRFRHMKTVERVIGHKPGTGGSSGVGFLPPGDDILAYLDGNSLGRPLAATRERLLELVDSQWREGSSAAGRRDGCSPPPRSVTCWVRPRSVPGPGRSPSATPRRSGSTSACAPR